MVAALERGNDSRDPFGRDEKQAAPAMGINPVCGINLHDIGHRLTVQPIQQGAGSPDLGQFPGGKDIRFNPVGIKGKQ
jgi:hypothetical protein